jgi:hypothetical protein
MLAMIAVAVFGFMFVVPDAVSARASGASRASRAAAFSSGSRGHLGVAFRHNAFSRGTFALGHRGIGRHGRAVGRRDGAFERGEGVGAAGFDPGVGFNGSGNPGCQVQRVQIDDLYGWRVRDMLVCPEDVDTSAARLLGSPSDPREVRPDRRLRRSTLPIEE